MIIMDKLIDFLKKEVPSNAMDLNNAINTTLEILDRTRAAVIGNVPKLYQNGRHDEVNDFTDADRQLMNIENHLREFVNNVQANTTLEQTINNNITDKITTSKPDYDSCKVDETESYNLDADFSKKRPISFIFEGKKYYAKTWNRLLVMVCELLNKKNPELFQSFTEDKTMQGRTRKYFIRQESEYHQKVGGTDIWVLTNNDGSANCRTIIKMLEKYNIPITSMEIFLRADYSLLSEDDENEDENVNVKKN